MRSDANDQHSHRATFSPVRRNNRLEEGTWRSWQWLCQFIEKVRRTSPVTAVRSASPFGQNGIVLKWALRRNSTSIAARSFIAILALARTQIKRCFLFLTNSQTSHMAKRDITQESHCWFVAILYFAHIAQPSQHHQTVCKAFCSCIWNKASGKAASVPWEIIFFQNPTRHGDPAVFNQGTYFSWLAKRPKSVADQVNATEWTRYNSCYSIPIFLINNEFCVYVCRGISPTVWNEH